MSSTSPHANDDIGHEDENRSSKRDFNNDGLFMNTSTPINLQLQGTFKKSFAFYSLKVRLPVILTKVIDYLSREGARIISEHNASVEDVRRVIEYISQLKNELVTNKKYIPLKVDTAEARRWNEYIQAADPPYYFTNVWLFSECYVYRRLREACELTNGLRNFDPFDEQKDRSFADSLEPMCVVADKLTDMVLDNDDEKRRVNFITLLKICLWANKCDLSLSKGEQVSLSGKARAFIDPFMIISDLTDMLLVDDSAAICDQVIAKADSMAKFIKKQGISETSMAESTEPQAVMFDIVCDNSGYELFSDLCLAHYLISQKIVQKVRFHVKNIPWFVSDVTPRDFKFVINSCEQANYYREVAAQTNPEPSENKATEELEPFKVINSDKLRALGRIWKQYVDDGTFILMSDDFWTSPHAYKDMKKYDPDLYKKLQLAVAVLFKGDLNYRKLLGETNWISTLSFEQALQGFMPAPVIALRTVKADLICGLPEGKFEELSKIDEKWMEKGDYGVIQFCARSEPLKGKICEDGQTCNSATPVKNQKLR